ncbi:hypothetical protein DAETH_48310 (plasmid) [Deinococcus aetherius]|uniref:PadR family transcriptional regulator n=1 Tax=Deinococcus aetherius TaxID=200252 RepID=A0ABN6RNK4_9DEIO|nr:hypothetical protein [Deinococcus aetherius]BDP44862.1 hypothetical protein DAETH_48310 [Deinococcus aetherius]
MKSMPAMPDEYLLLSVLCAVPLSAVQSLELAGLRVPDEPKTITPMADEHRALLRRLTREGRMRWVPYGPDGGGYILTETGTETIDRYFERLGPAHAPRRGPALGELARLRLAAQRTRLLDTLHDHVQGQA